MFSGFGGFDGPLFVEMVGQGYVDGVDFGIRQQLLVAAIGPRNIPFGGERCSPEALATGNRDQFAAAGRANSRYQTLVDACSAEQAPAQRGLSQVGPFPPRRTPARQPVLPSSGRPATPPDALRYLPICVDSPRSQKPAPSGS